MISILIAGDFVPIERVEESIQSGDYSYFIDVLPYFQKSDYSIVNLESPVLKSLKKKPIDKTGPNLSCSIQSVDSLKKLGVNCVTLANNHFYDQGEQGVIDTINVCDEYDMEHIGGGYNIYDAAKILYKTINGKVFAFMNICENEWSISTNMKGGSAPLNLITNYYDIQSAKAKSDYLIIIVHGGIEMYQLPTPRMQETYRFFIDAGADIVVNHHQHCYSGYEIYKHGKIFYGLGNFCFDKNDGKISEWNYGYILNLFFKDEDKSFEIVPYVQCAELPIIKILDGNEKCLFQEKLASLNQVIINTDSLYSRFRNYTSSLKEKRLLDLEPFHNRYIKYLQRIHLFPRFIDRECLKSMLMRIQCESNREVLRRILRDYFEI